MRRTLGELLGLCAYGTKFTERTLGGQSEITCPDLMHALGIVRAPEVGKRLVRMKYLIEDQRQSLVECYLLAPVSLRATHERWAPEMSAVMDETLRRYLAADSCPSCNGAKARMIGPQYLHCTDCEGTGRPSPLPDTPFGERVGWLLGLCNDWEGQVLGGMARILGLVYEPD